MPGAESVTPYDVCARLHRRSPGVTHGFNYPKSVQMIRGQRRGRTHNACAVIEWVETGEQSIAPGRSVKTIVKEEEIDDAIVVKSTGNGFPMICTFAGV